MRSLSAAITSSPRPPSDRTTASAWLPNASVTRMLMNCPGGGRLRLPGRRGVDAIEARDGQLPEELDRTDPVAGARQLAADPERTVALVHGDARQGQPVRQRPGPADHGRARRGVAGVPQRLLRRRIEIAVCRRAERIGEQVDPGSRVALEDLLRTPQFDRPLGGSQAAEGTMR